jgi:hypothetical protein
MRRRPAFRAVIIVIATLFGVPNPSNAEQPRYPYELKDTNPRVLHLLQSILPSRLKGEEWIYNLQGTADPFVVVTIDGELYDSGFVCKPHECGSNMLSVLLRVDGSRAVALLAQASRETWFGNPTQDEQDALRRRLN